MYFVMIFMSDFEGQHQPLSKHIYEARVRPGPLVQAGMTFQHKLPKDGGDVRMRILAAGNKAQTEIKGSEAKGRAGSSGSNVNGSRRMR